MRRISIFGKAFLAAAMLVLSLGTISCKEKPETDTEEVAEDQNEAKFDNNEEKEDDSDYLVFAAETDLEEIDLGKLALTKSANGDVKSLAQMMIDQHTKSAAETKKLAEAKNISLPASTTEDGKEAFNDLNKKTGADFDKKYAQMMVDGHEKAISKMEKAADKANDPEIRAWAANMIPTLQTHLEHAKLAKEKIDAVK